ncbi:hypothetical protein DN603_26785 [Raoultella planticola]|uniref:Disulfide bond formation protein B n=1 Tax=Raoultella planticola TaxID=575 RepID=A0A443VF80_RAOPL|nr:disulfide bond formation protein B [Raoultella planticola]RWT16091.1 hypothetical protein DN603_26785 [Raoultella planticola]
MPEYVYLFSQKRSCWIMIAGSAFVMGLLTLFLAAGGVIDRNHIFYEEYALCGIVMAGIIGAYAPRISGLRYGAIVLWSISTFGGLRLSLEQFLTHFSALEGVSSGIPKQLPVWFISVNDFMQAFITTDINSNNDNYFIPGEIAKWILFFFVFHLVIVILTIFSQLSVFKSQS